MKHSQTPWVMRPSSNPKNGTLWRDIVATGQVFSEVYVGEALEENAKFILRACNNHEDLVSQLREALAMLEDLRDKHLNHTAAVVRALVQKRIEAITNTINQIGE